jgi:hypothetical protein
MIPAVSTAHKAGKPYFMGNDNGRKIIPILISGYIIAEIASIEYITPLAPRLPRVR